LGGGDRARDRGRMRPARIDQVVHVLAYKDAIGNHVIRMREVLRDAGFESEIYSGEVHPELRNETFPIADLADLADLSVTSARGTSTRGGGRWLLFHHSIGSKVADVVLTRPEPLLIDYHNITPPDLIDGWAPKVREELVEGEEQLVKLAPKAFFGLAHSEFSEAELRAAGCEQTRVVPPLFDIDRRTPPDRSVLKVLESEKADGGRDWLFVGRISPHKAQHDLIKALAAARAVYDPKARLHLVGTSLGEDYPRALDRFAKRIGVGAAVRTPGAVPDAVLSAYYEAADVFVCASDHEGFCVPLVEAMARGLPVVAYSAAAVGETVGDGGIVLGEKSPLLVAAAVDRLTSNRELARRIGDSGRRRAAELAMPAGAQSVTEAIEEAVKVAAGVGIA
jgi:L-malate glycosyltransferase